MDWLFNDPIIQVREYLEIFDIDEEQVGLVIGPRLDDDYTGVKLEVNVRVLDDEEALYAVDGVFPYEEGDILDYFTDVYPVMIERFEAAFPDAQLQYYEP